MARKEDVLDPREEVAGDAGVRPVVALPRSGAPTWLLASLGVGAAAILFVALESRRQSASEPEIAPRGAETALAPAAPPPLVLPPEPAPVVRIQAPAASIAPAPAPPVRAPRMVLPSPPPPPQIVYVPQQGAEPPPPPQPPPRVDTTAALVVDATAGGAGGAQAAPAGGPPEAGPSPGLSSSAAVLGGRARAGTLANKSATVPQGTLIPAVMETAFNSDRPGFARAIVSRDIRGFDGKRVLIPRGSRLIGEYRSDTQQGQKRALINWVRLVRPDGVTITIGSPSTDTLGRGGVKADVNTHFFQRFAGAILKSTIDIGLTLAAVAGGRDGVLVALPGTLQGSGISAPIGGQQIRPTLKVPPARSISVFVARDLDFGGASER